MNDRKDDSASLLWRMTWICHGPRLWTRSAAVPRDGAAADWFLSLGIVHALNEGGVQVIRLTMLGLAVLLALAARVTEIATSTTGATTMLDLATADSSVRLDVSVVSSTLAAPGEFALQNECYFSGEVSGLPDSYQKTDIIDWIYAAPAPYGDVPHAIMTVHLNTVPAGSTCRVSLVEDDTVVTGSMTQYRVVR